MIKKKSPFLLSALAHLALLAILIFSSNPFFKFSNSDNSVVEVFVTAGGVKSASLPKQVSHQPPSKTAKAKESEDGVKEDSKVSLNSEPQAQTGQADSVGAGSGNSSDVIAANESLITTQVSVIKKVDAVYPKEAISANISGPVTMNVLIAKTGTVLDVKVVKGLGHGLDEAAVAALKQFVFKPAKIHDEPVAVLVRYTYRFTLQIH